MQILRANENPAFDGCDFVVQLEKTRENTPIKLLQLTDMQVIDSTQRRTFDRIRIDEINAWLPKNFDTLCGDHIRSLVAQTSPDLIFITGDIVYGSFDDKGTTLEWLCRLMDGFKIPWAPVFGNHDNESKKGVAWQCEQFEKSEYCLFKRGNVSGNGNYTVGVAVENALQCVLYMLDSNGCWDTDSEEVIKQAGIYPDQLALMRENAKRIETAQKKKLPALAAFHIPTDEFAEAETAKGYKTDERELYALGASVPAKDGDFGVKYDKVYTVRTDESFMQTLQACNVKGVFVGHFHSVNTCITYKNIRWVFGLKTGQYDSHIVGALGGTLVRLSDETLDIAHVPALVPCGPYPGRSPLFKNLLGESERLLEE